jgi:Tol biopolymer transport system component
VRSVAVIVIASAAVAAAASAAAPSRIVFAANRAPLWWGEVYRVGPSGRRIDLSRSPARDYASAISTSGSKVAFVSERGGRTAVYVTGMSGGPIRRVSPFLFAPEPSTGYEGEISWSPDDRRLAIWLAQTPSKLYLSGPGRAWRVLSDHSDRMDTGATWSPDGRFLSFVTYVRGVHVVTPSGKTAWEATGERASWGNRRLAVAMNSYTVDIFDEAGHRVDEFAGQYPAWSSDGKRLATLSKAGRLQVRPGDATTAPKASGFKWLGPRIVRLDTATGEVGYDVIANRRVTLPNLAQRFDAVAYVDGSRVVANVPAETADRLEVSPGKVLDTAPPCDDYGGFGALQFAPGGRTVVYETNCPAPPADIYSVAPDGKGLTRLTRATTDEIEPSMSPDGTKIAYVSTDNAVHCGGCDRTLWLADGNGRNARMVQRAPTADETPYDDAPSFSPDGTRVLFARSGPNTETLYVADAATGTAQTLGIDGEGPVWGPSRIAYRSEKGLATAAPDGSDVRLVPGTASTTAYAWSPDGQLALLGTRRAKLSIVIGEKTIALPSLAPTVRFAGLAWSPDGSQLVFTAEDADRVSDLYTVRVDGTHLTRVTHDLGAISSVSWR